MATLGDWVEGARLRTLPAALSPLLVGTGAAHELGALSVPRAALALGVSLAFQLGVNYANDYSDGIRGTDENRVGPMRLTGSGAARPAKVKAVALTLLAIGAAFGFGLVVLSGYWWLLGVGGLCVVAAWGYTGGKNPYGYLGLGDVGVFIFFGLVAVLGTCYTQAGRISWVAIGGAIAIGLLACAILMANNVRDIASDVQSGKRTLAVRLGEKLSRWVYMTEMTIALLLGIAIVAPRIPALLAMVALMIATIFPCLRMVRGASGRQLIGVLKHTGFIELGYSIIILLGLVFD